MPQPACPFGTVCLRFVRGMAKTSPTRLGVKAALFEPGERLGWIFQDRFRLWKKFEEPPPVEWEDAPWHGQRIKDLRRKRTAAMVLGAGVAFACAAGYFLVLIVYRFIVNWSQSQPYSFGTTFAMGAWAISMLPPLVVLIGVPLFFTIRIERAFRARDRAWKVWRTRQQAHQENEQGRIGQLFEWGAARLGPGTRRVDIFGGNLVSWEALLTVFGTSMLRESPPVTVVDLSEELVSDELYRLAVEANCSVDRQVLPADLAESDLLSGLDARHLVDVLIESFHGDGEGADRGERTMDARILHEICGALGDDLTMARIGEALRAMMGEPGSPRLLTPQEWDRVSTELFSGAYVERAHERLRRLEAHLHPLAALGTRPLARDRDPRLRCLAVVNDGPNPFSDLLVDLIVQWTMRQVAQDEGKSSSRLLVVTGADKLRSHHLERLSDICDRRQVRLVYLFRHLREQSLQLIGGGAVGFMQLGNHEEAERAAGFIGREHKFVVSSISRGLSGGRGHSGGSTGREGDANGGGRARRGIVFDQAAGYIRSRTRTWGTSRQYSEQTGWSWQASEQRVYEYRVEPRALQDLPDYALLLVESGAQGPRLRVIECNPDILSLPRTTTDVLPEHQPRLLIAGGPLPEAARPEGS
jgi:hypothetical protein